MKVFQNITSQFVHQDEFKDVTLFENDILPSVHLGSMLETLKQVNLFQ